VFYNALIYLRFASWKKKYIKRVPKWIDAAGEMEAFLSLAVIGRVKSVSAFPAIIEDNKPVVDFEELYHPLIKESTAVSNPCHIKEELRIITGSNMSGKTTYLRSLGVNVCLAYSGAMVCSKEASLSIFKMFTSMRVMDDVGRGISSFYAEVLRIKAMSEFVKNKVSMLVLIDEIFKGTNSADRIIGAKGVIGTLAKPWVCGMITTHDFELCDLAEAHSNITNNHFDEYFEEDELKFEYKIKDGRCVTTNAIHILKMAGINI
jgi:DNA mismatch repair ATPase MutS